MNILRKSFLVRSKTLGLHSVPRQKVSALAVLKPSFIMNKIKQQLTSRAGLFRLLLVGTTVHLIATFSGSLLLNR